MSTLRNRFPQSGIFFIPPDLRTNGSLTLSGAYPELVLWSDNPIAVTSGSTITGVLNDLTKVSLIGCSVRSDGHVGKGDQIRHKYLLSPQCVGFGSQYISHDENVVHEISFTLEHAVALFHDTDAYGTIFNNSEAVGMVAKIDNPDSNYQVRDWNWVSYYTGKRTVFASDTAIGRVSASHCPVFTLGKAHDHGLKKNTELSITFDDPLYVMEAVYRMGRVLQFFDLVIGYSQNTSNVSVHTGFDDPSQTVELYAADRTTVHSTAEEDEPNLRTNALIHPVEASKEFSNVLSAWLEKEKDAEWGTARMRIAHNWGKRNYDYNRLIAAANVFDLLPNNIYGSNPPLSSDLAAAIEESREIFQKLPKSEERSGVLAYFGRVRSRTLKKKICFRAKPICKSIKHLLPELETAIIEAVNLRNHYVHGARSCIKSNQRVSLLPFLTNSLEFVFFTSDLIEAGWNIVEWCNKSKPIGHPIYNYLVYYKQDLRKLKSALE